MITKFKVFGLQRSGTNFLYDVIRYNYVLEDAGERPIDKMWKHIGYNQETAQHLKQHEDILAFYIHKSPYKWIDSVIANHVDLVNTNRNIIIDSNIDDEMIQSKNDLFKIKPTLNIKVLARMWFEHVNSWEERRNLVQIVTYDNLLRNTVDWIDKHAEAYELKKDWNSPIIPTHVDMTGHLWDTSRKEYSLAPNQFNYLEDKHLHIINEELFAENFFGYERIYESEMIPITGDYAKLQSP